MLLDAYEYAPSVGAALLFILALVQAARAAFTSPIGKDKWDEASLTFLSVWLVGAVVFITLAVLHNIAA